MSGWSAVEQELARWRDAGREAVLWWRDDDVAEATPALDRLLDLQRAHDVPLALAVVPATATAALATRLGAAQGIDLLQHGYAHTNHAPAADKKEELGAHRPAMVVLGELGTGRMALERLFGPRALPVLVPPWNRIAPGLVPALPEIGYRGLSTFGARKRVSPVSGLLQVNTHIDLIDWKARRFAGAEALLAAFAQALDAARTTGEPVGLLSHHLAMDEAAWSFLQSFWGAVKGMPGMKIATAHDLFASREARA
ncbi:MAG: polysaccharide deacetylase family protein [Reyranella sp.]|uniref:polysaccharide deacetylase family protein n=1 Tax=Reyranella sp. TaxID=1929291 RepID=UPI001ACCE88A|nr:polysaccharide deacetylase family protein [Reyranella sp.]MBN9087383.1 polysaccharide deacetylase family protein [Reyranella sp.]